MKVYPLLFDLAPQKPTTREIANRVKELGTQDALPDAAHLADGATYQEVTCRSALNAVKGMPFDWTLNPYRGCTHGCHYCYTRRYHSQQFELNADDEFASVILVKKNFVEVLTRELARPSWTGEYVAVGTATDCYQPIKGHYKLTRGAIGALIRARNPMGLITKGPMVVRDREAVTADQPALLHRTERDLDGAAARWAFVWSRKTMSGAGPCPDERPPTTAAPPQTPPVTTGLTRR